MYIVRFVKFLTVLLHSMVISIRIK